MAGIIPLDTELRRTIPSRVASTPILDRMLRDDGARSSIKGGTVAGVDALGTTRKGPKESYLPTLQAIPGKIEFTYLPPNSQEVLVLPVPKRDMGVGEGMADKRYYALVLGGDTAKNFTPRDVAWCREVASWI